MAQKRRVYIVRKTHDPIEDEVYSSLKKLVDELDTDVNYDAIVARLYRAKKRLKKETGTDKQIIRMRDNSGNPITIEIKDLQ